MLQNNKTKPCILIVFVLFKHALNYSKQSTWKNKQINKYICMYIHTEGLHKTWQSAAAQHCVLAAGTVRIKLNIYCEAVGIAVFISAGRNRC
jgi:hypothetical protein